MCGIAGIVGRIDERSRTALQRMSDRLKHRGPDAEGSWESAPDERGWGAMFAHRRLSILDLSPAGAQPMKDPATGHVLSFNGEIYNYVELRSALAAAGETFHSTGDTVVVARLLGLRGANGVASLRGMFALASWDPGRRRLLLARDPLGIKPLYLFRNPDPRGDWSLLFASEVKAILASGLAGTPRLHPSAPAAVAWSGFMTAPQTAVEGVESVWPGELRLFDGSGSQQAAELFWRAPEQRDAREIDEEQLASVLQECVRQHLASDVPLAVFLSGGVDSSAVANLAQRASGGRVHTFTLGFEEQEYDESPIAERVARAIGTEHHRVTLSGDDFVRHLDAALDSLDQPTFDGLNSFYLSRAVREAGFKVVLAGTGGDELFGGYRSFSDLPRLHSWARRFRAVPRPILLTAARLLRGLLAPGGSEFSPQTRWAKLPHMVDRGDDLLALYQLAYALFLPETGRELVAGQTVNGMIDGLPAVTRDRVLRETSGRASLSAISVMEQRLYLGERLLRDSDAASMASSLEMRLPLVDQILFEAVDRLPESTRYRPLGAKAILRRVGLRGLDPALFDRPKRGFELPYARWIRRGLGEAMDQTMRDPGAIARAGLQPQAVERLWRAFQAGAPGVYWSRVWAIYVLIHWCHRNKVYA